MKQPEGVTSCVPDSSLCRHGEDTGIVCNGQILAVCFRLQVPEQLREKLKESHENTLLPLRWQMEFVP